MNQDLYFGPREEHLHIGQAGVDFGLLHISDFALPIKYGDSKTIELGCKLNAAADNSEGREQDLMPLLMTLTKQLLIQMRTLPTKKGGIDLGEVLADLAFNRVAGSVVRAVGVNLDQVEFDMAIRQNQLRPLIEKRQQEQELLFRQSGARLEDLLSPEQLSFVQRDHSKKATDWKTYYLLLVEKYLKNRIRLDLQARKFLMPAINGIVTLGDVPKTLEQIDLMDQVMLDWRTWELGKTKDLGAVDKVTFSASRIVSKYAGNALEAINLIWQQKETKPLFKQALETIMERHPGVDKDGAVVINLASGDGKVEETEMRGYGLRIIHVDYQDFRQERARIGLSTNNFIQADLTQSEDRQRALKIIKKLTYTETPTGYCVLINPINSDRVIKGAIEVARLLGMPLMIKSDHGDSQQIIRLMAKDIPGLKQLDAITWEFSE